MDQGKLFDNPDEKKSVDTSQNYHDGQFTEQLGAQAGAIHAGTIRFNLLRLLAVKPMTDDELIHAYEEIHGKQRRFFGNTSRRRRLELVKLGLVKDSGKLRPSDQGHQTIVWELTKGKDFQ